MFLCNYILHQYSNIYVTKCYVYVTLFYVMTLYVIAVYVSCWLSTLTSI